MSALLTVCFTIKPEGWREPADNKLGGLAPLELALAVSESDQSSSDSFPDLSFFPESFFSVYG